MTIRSWRPSRWAQFIPWAMLGWACMSSGAEKLTWLMRDLPPLTVFEGPQKGQGVIDQLMPLLIASLPEYEHVVVKVNRARAMQMLQDPTLTCDPALVWNPSRAQSIAYSAPVMGLHSNGLVIRQSDEPKIAPYVTDQSVDLKRLLNAQGVRLGVVAKRSYGMWIDEQLAHSEDRQLFVHHGNDALGSLLQMQHAGRLEGVLGYWPEIQSKARQQGLPFEALLFYRILGAPTYQPIYIGCSDTPAGHEALGRINRALATLGPDALREAEAQWQEPGHPDDYVNGQASPPKRPR